MTVYNIIYISIIIGTVHIFHGNVYNDLMQNALIVPLKILKGHNYV